MQRNLDCIQFESRSEIENIMVAIDNHVKQNPKEKNSKDLERLFDLLDVMHMEW